MPLSWVSTPSSCFLSLSICFFAFKSTVVSYSSVLEMLDGQLTYWKMDCIDIFILTM